MGSVTTRAVMAWWIFVSTVAISPIPVTTFNLDVSIKWRYK